MILQLKGFQCVLFERRSEIDEKICGGFIPDRCREMLFKCGADLSEMRPEGKSDVKMYFVKNNPKDCRCERHRLNIPTLGWVRMKEKGYIPTTKG